MVRWPRFGLVLVLMMALVALSGVMAWPASAQIDRNVRDRVVPAAVQVAINVRWSEQGFEIVVPLPVGSGTIVSADGLVLTNFHVIDPVELETQIERWGEELVADLPGVELEVVRDEYVILGSDGVHPPVERYSARVVQQDPALDLAVLAITADANGAAADPGAGGFPFVPLGDSDAVGLGDRIHLFSYPAIGGDTLTYTGGVISGFLREEAIDGLAWITTDAVMSGGSSGGTAVNENGALIGVPTQGSELDCRPGDTNRDGIVDVDDIGCIPLGGSLGQLRPVNLAKPLLAAAGAGVAQGPPEQTTSRPDLDLPRLALKPVDLARLGLPGYVVDWGQLADAAGAPQMLGFDPSWGDRIVATGLQEAYALRNMVTAPTGATRYVTTLVWKYADAEGAAAGFDLIEREIEATNLSTDQAPATVIGEQTEVTTWRYSDVGTGESMEAAEVTFRVEHLVGAVRVTGLAGNTAQLVPEAEELAIAFASILDRAVNGLAPESAELSRRIVRFVDDGVAGSGDYYLMQQGSAIPLWWHEKPEAAGEWTAVWRALGVQDAYETEIFLPADPAVAGPRSRIGIRLFEFDDEANASAYVQSLDLDLQSAGAWSLNERLDAPHFGDESRTLTFETDWWSDVDPEVRATTAIRSGDTVAVVEIGSVAPVPATVLEEIAAAQAECLARGCAAMTMPAPEWQLERDANTGLLGPETPGPSPIPIETPSPSPIPIPAPTLLPLVWGIFDDFEDASFQPEGTEFSEISINEGVLVLTITEPGGLDGFIFNDMPTEGRDIAFVADVASTSGWGEINLRLGTASGDTEWFFAIDPVTSEWSLHRTSIYTDELFYWVEPRSFATLAPGAITSLEARVIDGAPLLLVNGMDVVGPTGIEMPEMPGNLVVGFGAGINPHSLTGHGNTITVTFDQIQLFELGT